MVVDFPFTRALKGVNYMGGKNIGYDPYSNTYKQGWKDPLNISWKEQRDQRQGQSQN